MSKLESPEQFVDDMLGCIEPDGLFDTTRAHRLIEADRNAVRLELLDELEAETSRLADRAGNAFPALFRKEAADTLRAKYGKKD